MKFNSKGNDQQSISLKGEKKGFSMSEAIKQQVFYNSRKDIFDYIESRGQINSAVLNVTFSRGHEGLFSKIFTPYHVSYSLVYKLENGEARVSDNFFEKDYSSEGSLIPKYVIEVLQTEDTFNINMDSADLQILYNELDIHIDEVATYESIISLCKKKNVNMIKMIDRVFYTRIECYNASNVVIGSIHVGALRNLPSELADFLYPGGQVEYSI